MRAQAPDQSIRSLDRASAPDGHGHARSAAAERAPQEAFEAGGVGSHGVRGMHCRRHRSQLLACEVFKKWGMMLGRGASEANISSLALRELLSRVAKSWHLRARTLRV